MIFISYSHNDNELATEGWVSRLHELLESRLIQLLGGNELKVFRDTRGLRKENETLSEEIKKRIHETLFLMPIVSPGYLRSGWCSDERNEFLAFHKDRNPEGLIFGIEKIPVMEKSDFPQEIKNRFVYRFYKTDPESNKAREIFPGEKEFIQCVFDLADDLVHQFNAVKALKSKVPEPERKYKGTVYLATVASDLHHKREEVKRELEKNGYKVLPDRELPAERTRIEAYCMDCLDESQISIHLFGENYGAQPENYDGSLQQLQFEIGEKFLNKEGFIRFVWVSNPGHCNDARQRKILKDLETLPTYNQGVERLEGSLDEFKSFVIQALKGPFPSRELPAKTDTSSLLVPYVGLRPFEEYQEPLFFGRESQVRELTERLLENRFLAVVGTSGSGKSSLIRAGFIPHLRKTFAGDERNSFLMVKMRPGNGPIGNLAAALLELKKGPLDPTQRVLAEGILRRNSQGILDYYREERLKGRLLIFVDQFEEIFRFREKEPGSAGQFIHLLSESAKQTGIPVFICLTMRSEFLGRCPEFEGLSGLVDKGQFLIPRLKREELKRAIELPAAIFGGEIAPRLVTRLLNEVGNDPDQLPILQHALMRLWSLRFADESRTDRIIDLEDYEQDEVGGQENALNHHLDSIIPEISKFDFTEEQVKRIFQTLTTTEKGLTLRRPMPLGQLSRVTAIPIGKLNGIMQFFCGPNKRSFRSFVQPPTSEWQGEDTVLDISHESLIRKWVRLAEWVEEEAEFAREFSRLNESAARWEKHEAGTLTEPEIIRWEKLQEGHSFSVDWCELYIQTESQEHVKEEAQIAYDRVRDYVYKSREKIEEDQKKTRTRRNVLVSLTAISIFFALGAILLFFQSNQARREAEFKEIQAQSLSLVAYGQALSDKNPSLGLRLLERACLNSPATPPLVLRALNQSLLELQTPWARAIRAQFRHAGPVRSAVFSPDGNAILTASEDHTAGLWGLQGKMLAGMKGHLDAVRSAVFSPDGNLILTASADHTARLWDLQGNMLAELKGHLKGLNSAVFSPDGNLILTASEDRTARLWDLQGNSLAEMKGHQDDVNSAVFSPDGNAVLTSSWDSTARVWDLNGMMLAKIEGHQYPVLSSVFSPDGNSVLTISSYNSTARLWDLKGKPLAEMKGHRNDILSAEFSPDGKSILTTSSDFTARLWDLKGKTLAELKGHQGRIYSGVFSPDGNTILTASQDNTARLWDLEGNILAELKGHQATVNSAVFSPGGNAILTASRDNTAKLWNLEGDTLTELKGHQAVVNSAVFSTHGNAILTASRDYTARLWDLKGKTLAEMKGHQDGVNSAVFSPDGKSILTTSDDKTARLWDLRGTTLAEMNGHQDIVRSAAFSPDGNSVLTISRDHTARLWDLTGKALAKMEGHQHYVYSGVFSPDGNSVLTASWDHTARLWDLKGKALAEMKGHEGPVFSAVFSPDGNSILTASGDRTARLWDLKGNTLAEMKGHQAFVLSAAFSPDGNSILTISRDNTARLWDLGGNTLAEMKGHQAIVLSAVFSPDGNSVLTASEDHTARLWDLEGNLLAEMKGHLKGVNSAVFSPDGNSILTASGDQTARLWPTPGRIIDWLKTATIYRPDSIDWAEFGFGPFEPYP
ncbi:MAG: TIR domain-containing protein [Bacteroidia bacterium]|nr:TIR domain-containing protein [Bacteroidia bacterium]